MLKNSQVYEQIARLQKQVTLVTVNNIQLLYNFIN